MSNLFSLWGFPGGWVVKNPPANARDASLIFWLEISPGRKWQPFPIFLPGKFHQQRSLAGYSPWNYRVWRDWAYIHECVTHCFDLQNNFKVGSILANDHNAVKAMSIFRWAMLYIPHVDQIGSLSAVLDFYWQTQNTLMSTSIIHPAQQHFQHF